MRHFLKSGLVGLMLVGALSTCMPQHAQAAITGRSVVAGILSLVVWPGIGQAVNNNSGDKVVTHAVIGLLPPFRFWSGYDALVNRQGGYWKGRI